MVIKYLIVVLGIVCGNLYCNSGTGCTSCSAGYYNYNSISCLSACPQGCGASGSGSTCQSPCTGAIFSVQFYQSRTFASSLVGPFSTQSNLAFNDQSQTTPIPTKERGFYFGSSSVIQSSTIGVLGPDFSLTLAFKAVNCTSGSSCTVFSIKEAGLLFKLEVSSNSMISTWNLVDSSGASSQTLVTDFEFGLWYKVIISSSQGLGTITLSHIYIDTYEYATTSVSYPKEFRNSGSQPVYSFGDTLNNSFIGFIYDASGYNYAVSSYLISVFWIDCNYNEYFLNPQCLPCDPSCSEWPWCVRGGQCSSTRSGVCYSPSCTSCTGYLKSDCSQSNADCWKFCSSCSSTFTCTSCDSRYIMIDNLCLYQPYNWNPTSSLPSISLTFDTFEQYYDGLFQSGHDPSTYYPYHYPQTDDPIPMKNRGIYFNGRSYLKSISPVSMNYKNTFIIWAKPEGQGLQFWNAPSIQLFSVGSASYLLTDTETWIRYNTYKKQNLSGWNFYVYTIDFSGQATTSTIIVNTNSYSYLTMSGYALYDIKTTVYILGEGFLYSLNAYNSIVSNPASYYSSAACVGGVCLWTCDYFQYFDGSSCQDCSPSCTGGCIGANSCTDCSGSGCLTCSGFNSAACESYASSSCSPVWSASMVYNGCCSSSCATCDGPFDFSCLSCAAGQGLLNKMCVTACPTGYSLCEGECVQATPVVAEFTFDTIYDTYRDTEHNVTLSTGATNSFYPELLPSDPIPATSRGLYFRGTSYMTSSDLHLSTSFTIAFWIRLKHNGVLFTKNHLQTTLAYNINLDITTVSSFSCFNWLANEWDQIIIQVWSGQDGKINALVASLSSKMGTYTGGYDGFLDTASPITLGNAGNSFYGFIYRFNVYNALLDLSTLSSDTVCTHGMISSCLWDCDIEYYWNGDSCTDCESKCDYGCRAPDYCNICYDVECHYCHDYTSPCDTCKNNASMWAQCQCDPHFYWNLSHEACLPCDSACYLCTGPLKSDCVDCLDSNCVECANYDYNSCTLCSYFYEAIEGRCNACNSTQYYDNKNNTCGNCTLPCYTCQSSSLCSSCIEHAYFSDVGTCSCDLGYSFGGSSCNRNSFRALYSISNQNVIKITFTEPLGGGLKSSDMTVRVDANTVDITLNKIDSSTWTLELNLQIQPTDSSRVYVNITAVLVSSLNSLFVNQPYSALLFVVSKDNTAQGVLQATSLAKAALGLAMSTVLGSSILMVNPQSFFFFLQTLELYYYVLIYACDLSPTLNAFLNALNGPSYIPEPFGYMIPDSEGVALTGKINDFGYNTNLILLNSGVNLSCLVILALLLPVSYGLSKVPWKWFSGKMKQCFSSYKYCVVSRCFIQMFLEFLINSCIGIYFTQFGNTAQIVDFILCCVLLVRII